MAQRLLRYPKMSVNDLPDLVSLVVQTLAEMYDRGATDSNVWQKELWIRSRSVVRGYADSSALDGFGGMVAARRRRRSATIAAQRHPGKSEAEIVIAHNDEMSRQRSDAARQGALISEADFNPVTSQSLDALEIDIEAGIDDEAEAVADTVVSVEKAQLILDELDRVNPNLRPFAAYWLAKAIQGDIPSVAEMGKQFGACESTIRRWVLEVRACAISKLVADDGSLRIVQKSAAKHLAAAHR